MSSDLLELNKRKNALCLDDCVTISQDVVFRELDGEAVILNLQTGTYFGLDEVGTRIWNLIHRHGSLRQAFETLLEEYQVAPEVLEGDLFRLVGELCEKGLVNVPRAQQ